MLHPTGPSRTTLKLTYFKQNVSWRWVGGGCWFVEHSSLHDNGVQIKVLR
jgi:hypothetical protein